jgi:formiminotetrahydrofolate cyclodeaminase
MTMARQSDSSNTPAANGGAAGSDPYLTESVEAFLDQLAARTPAPGGGAAAAVTCAIAAGLVEMATSFASARGLERVHGRAHDLRERVAALAYADGQAYAVVLAALKMPPGPERHAHLDAAVAGAIACPMQVLEIASEVATLAADIAETGNRNLEGDAQLNVSLLSRHAATDAHLEDMRPTLARATRARERAVSAYAAV